MPSPLHARAPVAVACPAITVAVAIAGSRWLPLCIVLLAACCCDGGEQQWPVLLAQPPRVLRVGAGAARRVACAARGAPAPALDWRGAAGHALPASPHWRTLADGSLEVSWGVEVHAVRCRAANALGVALSRPVVIRTVSQSDQSARVEVIVANSELVVLRCAIAAGQHAADDDDDDDDDDAVQWVRDGAPLQLPALSPDAAAVAAGSRGEWLLLSARSTPAPRRARYSCARRDAAPAPAVALPTATAGAGEPAAAPRILAHVAAARARAGAALCLPCAADAPNVHYTWISERGGRGAAEGAVEWARGAALCFLRAAPAHGGAWLCRAHGVRGDASARTQLRVDDHFAVTVEPSLAEARAGGSVRFACRAPAGAALGWLHDGAALPAAGPELLLRPLARAHRGVYQCEARRGGRVDIASAYLRIADSPPELVYTFIEQALRGGPVALRCAAAAAPPARLSWLRDGVPLDARTHPHRYSIGEEQSAAGDVVSTLNISAATHEDGGRYTCRAQNDLGSVQHSARLNIYGPPLVRPAPPVRAVAGVDATVYCPYAGYPISSIEWERVTAAGAVPVGGEGRVSAAGAALRLRPALPRDAGRYRCTARAPAATARGDLELQVRNPPKISPFIFSPDLTEGSAVQVLCGVSSGDKPLYFTWLKDGVPLPADLQIEEKSLNEFSLLMFGSLSARHSGEYTCRVTNHAASAEYSATLTVKVSPAWQLEPHDVSAVAGAPLLLRCAARGHPPPAVHWQRRLGENGEESEHWTAVGSGTEVALSAARDVAGSYRCTADNGVGAPLIKRITVAVHEPAVIEVGAGEVWCAAGTTCALQCAARGDPPLEVRWTRGGAPPVGPWSPVAQWEDGGALVSRLSAGNARAVDAGEYRCHADNAHGRAERTLLLHVDEPPSAPTTLRQAGRGTRWVRLRWRQAGAATHYAASCAPLAVSRHVEPCNLTIESSTHGEQSAGAEREVCGVVSGLRAGRGVVLQVTARGRAGRSAPSPPLTVTTLEEVPSAAPQDVQVRPGGFGELHVSWAALDEEEWNGVPRGYAVSWSGAGGGTRATRGTALRLAGLAPRAPYGVAVRAYTAPGAGPAAAPVLAHTHYAGAEPARAVECTVGAPGLRVRWNGEPDVTYDVFYAPADFPIDDEEDEERWERPRVVAAAGLGVELRALRSYSNYSVLVRPRAPPGEPAAPAARARCGTAPAADAAPRRLRASAAGAALRVVWSAPRAPVSHYTLHARSLQPAGAEREVQRVAGGAVEVSALLMLHAPSELVVRAHYPSGGSTPSAPITVRAPPLQRSPAGARVWSGPRRVSVPAGARLLLPCAADGAPPLRRRWEPLPPRHAVTPTGDLVLDGLEASWSGEYTCSVSNTLGADAVTHRVRVLPPPRAPPALRLRTASTATLLLAWDPPSAAPLHGYTIHWWRADVDASDNASAVTEQAAGWDAAGARLAGLACGALYAVTLTAHHAHAHSEPSTPLLVRTLGDRPKPPSGEEFIWTNDTSMQFNPLPWSTDCPLLALELSVRSAGAGEGQGTERLRLSDPLRPACLPRLPPASWLHVDVLARSAAGSVRAAYRAATLTSDGERVGAPERVAARASAGALLPALGAALALAAAAAGTLALVWRRKARRRPRDPGAELPPAPAQYGSGPHKGGDCGTPAYVCGAEISPYATFSMARQVVRGAGERALAAAPSPSDSSGDSPCACRRTHTPHRYYGGSATTTLESRHRAFMNQ